MKGKKGLIAMWGVLLIVLIIMLVIGLFMTLYLNVKIASKTNQFNKDVSNSEASYYTRVLLNHKTPDGERLYEKLLERMNADDYEGATQDIYRAILEYYPDNNTGKWIMGINGLCYEMPVNFQDWVDANQHRTSGGVGFIPPKIASPEDCSVYPYVPSVTVPNPAGKNLLVFIKPFKPIDSEAIARQPWGTKADKYKGFLLTTTPSVSVDGKDLVRIEGIPNVVCDESVTDFGKICAANSALVLQLRKISEEVLQPQKMRIVVNQAYRTYDIQKALYNSWCAKGNCAGACNPDKSYLCPHMQSGAIDINLYQLDGNGAVSKNYNDADPKKVENLMCDYGFVRYHKEDWHFEYGTWRWQEIVKQRNGGREPCSY